ncbi:MAG TPA: aspartate aminotransferase family protein [Balneolaceae bacterium]|nr:aspartate aminotransferase family protein [Balneolaceae bacterium]
MNKSSTGGFDLKKLVEENRDKNSDLYKKHVNPVFSKVLKTIGFNRNYVEGRGAYLWDDKGEKYLDFLSGFGMFNMGRNHPVIKEVINDYLELNDTWKLAMGTNPLTGLLAEALLEKVPHLDKVYFGNSGTECVETALKFCRATTGKEKVVYCEHAFHGLTYGSLSINGSSNFKDGFVSFLPGPVNVPLNNLDALERAFQKNDIAGVILEPIQGKGVYPANAEYMLGVQKLCNKHDAVFIMDEIQTGMGRTGKLFCYQHVPDLEPDMVLVSKSLSGGMVPVGAVLMRDEIYHSVYSSMDRGKVHSSTFGGGGLPMACGLGSLAVTESENLPQNAQKTGEYMLEKLRAMIPKYDFLKEVRGKGLMIGIEFGKPKALRYRAAWKMMHPTNQSLFPQAIIMPLIEDHHILTQVAAHNVDIIKILPPLMINKGDADWFLEAFEETLDEVHSIGGPIWTTARHLTRFAVSG